MSKKKGISVEEVQESTASILNSKKAVDAKQYSRFGKSPTPKVTELGEQELQRPVNKVYGVRTLKDFSGKVLKKGLVFHRKDIKEIILKPGTPWEKIPTIIKQGRDFTASMFE